MKARNGQIIVILVLAMTGLLAMTALIIDGGIAMARQRETQNAADSASLAGTTVLLKALAKPGEATDADVLSAVQTAFLDNGVTLEAAFYVDFARNDLMAVGNPTGTIPGNAQGVRARGTQQFDTALGGVANLDSITTGAEATSLAGPPTGGTGIIPVTFSVPVEVCDGSSKQLIVGGDDWPIVTLETALADTAREHVSLVPLCKNGPGGVGWLDLCPATPPVKLEDQILGACGDISVDIPTWLVQNTGSPSNKKIEDNLNSLIGKVLQVPMFDGTCKDTPSGPLLENCPNPGMSGSKSYYHIPKFADFLLLEAYTQSTNSVPCNSAPGDPALGNGSTSCIKGWFVNYVREGPVGEIKPGAAPLSWSIQLVR
jgi:hypothetical protein